MAMNSHSTQTFISSSLTAQEEGRRAREGEGQEQSATTRGLHLHLSSLCEPFVNSTQLNPSQPPQPRTLTNDLNHQIQQLKEKGIAQAEEFQKEKKKSEELTREVHTQCTILSSPISHQ
jgi:hypothetical protein